MQKKTGLALLLADPSATSLTPLLKKEEEKNHLTPDT